MIGEIEFSQRGKKLKAKLNDRYRWTCSDREVESLLNEAFPADTEAVNTYDEARRFLLYRASSRLGGQVKTYR